MTLEESFHLAMLDIYYLAGKETGYWANYFLRSVKNKGGLATAKQLLKPKKGDVIEKGLQELIDAGRPDLSVEATVLKSMFSSLFNEDEITEAKLRINALPSATKRKVIPPELNHPDELPKSTEYTEGSIRSITVNAYERDQKARSACLEKFGYCCAVCEMNFLKTYGEMGKNFIHIHHKKPLATIRKEYKLNPSKDLIPVCPNCHAMLHTTNPPLGINELKAIYETQKTLCR